MSLRELIADAADAGKDRKTQKGTIVARNGSVYDPSNIGNIFVQLDNGVLTTVAIACPYTTEAGAKIIIRYNAALRRTEYVDLDWEAEYLRLGLNGIKAARYNKAPSQQIGTGNSEPIQSRRFLPGLVTVSSGLTVQVQEFFYYDEEGRLHYFEATTYDFTGNLPSSGNKQWVILAVSTTTHELTVLEGDEVTVSTSVSTDDLADINIESHIPLAGVLLKHDDTSLTENRFRDVRLWLGTSYFLNPATSYYFLAMTADYGSPPQDVPIPITLLKEAGDKDLYIDSSGVIIVEPSKVYAVDLWGTFENAGISAVQTTGFSTNINVFIENGITNHGFRSFTIHYGDTSSRAYISPVNANVSNVDAFNSLEAFLLRTGFRLWEINKMTMSYALISMSADQSSMSTGDNVEFDTVSESGGPSGNIILDAVNFEVDLAAGVYAIDLAVWLTSTSGTTGLITQGLSTAGQLLFESGATNLHKSISLIHKSTSTATLSVESVNNLIGGVSAAGGGARRTVLRVIRIGDA